MFRDADSSVELAQRARYEVLAEIMQHKGSSECYFDQGNPLNNADEYCAFEQLSVRSFTDSDPPEPQDGFLRHQLTEGLLIEQSTGTNPHQFGFVASTDTHLGAPGLVSEATFPGHGGAGKPASDSNEEPGLVDLLDYNPGGLRCLERCKKRKPMQPAAPEWWCGYLQVRRCRHNCVKHPTSRLKAIGKVSQWVD